MSTTLARGRIEQVLTLRRGRSEAFREVENEINSNHGGAFANFPGGKSRYDAFCLRGGASASVPSIFLRCQLNKPDGRVRARMLIRLRARSLPLRRRNRPSRSLPHYPRPPELKLKVKLTFAPPNNNGLSVLREEDGREGWREGRPGQGKKSDC